MYYQVVVSLLMHQKRLVTSRNYQAAASAALIIDDQSLISDIAHQNLRSYHCGVNQSDDYDSDD